jgi:uncharacterized protein (TIGR02266 family)
VAGSADDRRREDREPVVLRVEYPGADDMVHDYTANISRGGTFILTRRELALGTPLSVELSFRGLLEPIRLRARVRWRRDQVPADEQGVGVEFELQEPGVVERLAQLMYGIERRDPGLMVRTFRILIVEDNPHVADLLEEGLSKNVVREYEGRVRFQFDRVKDGQQALALARSQSFDLAIADIYLPVMDGPSFIKALRADPALANLPVIAVSAGGKSAREMAKQAGADFFVDKPMRLQEILHTVKKLIGV